MQRPVLAIVGVTAGGKSALAMELARHDSRIELVSVDSMQVYRGMDIGTAKATRAERDEVPHHLLDLVDVWEDFTVGEFQAAARVAVADIERRDRVPVLVGGSGLHLRAVIDNLEIPGQFPEVKASLEAQPTQAPYDRLLQLDPVAARRIEPTNRRRLVRAVEVTAGSGRPFSSFGPGLDTYGGTRFGMVGPRWTRSCVDRRIVDRYALQMEQGLLDEVGSLAGNPKGISRTAGQALGYRQFLRHILLDHTGSHSSIDESLEEAIVATRRFARRQERWFRRDPRITWVDVEANPMEAFDAVMREYKACI
ncbi:MAG: tRNA (adenosine(37)-N6)-dimethylallyltransferase MiaA [Acidimicrobiales bacterium]